MSMNVSVGNLESFVREKVALGEYESASEMVREGLRLLKRREELWRAKVQARIEEGMAQLRAGQKVSAQDAWAELKSRRDTAMAKSVKAVKRRK
jgi:antitoxin ParD1/3/4